MQRFGEKLRALRERHGMSQRALADALGWRDHVFLHRMEKGQRRPNAEHLLKISRLFDVSLDVLMKDELELEEP